MKKKILLVDDCDCVICARFEIEVDALDKDDDKLFNDDERVAKEDDEVII